MPGFNQRGPMNQGPMTGRGMGVCTGYRNAGMPGMGYGMGMGRRRGRQGFSSGFGPRGWGMGYGGNAASPPVTDSRDILKNREAMLEQELAAVRQQISTLSPADDE